MINIKKYKYSAIIGILLMYTGCVPSLVRHNSGQAVPSDYNGIKDTANTVNIPWKNFFDDAYLHALIDTALKNNQELNIILQEVNISRNEIRARKGQYLPFIDIGADAGIEKMGRYTRSGSIDANTDIAPGTRFPEPLPDFLLAANVSWQVDIWKKLRNAKKSAVYKYLSTTQGKHFMVTKLIAEIANAYYELMALDTQLEILRSNIEIQTNALDIVKMQKAAAKVTELAVRKFEAEVLKNQSRQFNIMQEITVTENRINFLVGRFPQPVLRNSQNFADMQSDSIQAGIPAQLLENRPDIQQAEQELAAAKLDVKVAKANFYPSLIISGGVGLQAFNPDHLIKAPESLMYMLAGELVGPLINRNAIKAEYYSANSRQIQSVYKYERTVLMAYIEVANQLANINNLKSSYEAKSKQVEALTQSISISSGLFASARADYMEVLMTQRDALESKFELIETKKQRMHAMVDIYQALGGGWQE